MQGRTMVLSLFSFDGMTSSDTSETSVSSWEILSRADRSFLHNTSESVSFQFPRSIFSVSSAPQSSRTSFLLDSFSSSALGFYFCDDGPVVASNECELAD
jgi:hypothetical protein